MDGYSQDAPELEPADAPANRSVLSKTRFRVAAFVWVLASSVISFVPASLLGPEWQSGKFEGVASFMLDLKLHGPFAAVTVLSIVLVLTVIADPKVREHAIVNAGLWLAASLALGFTIVLIASTGFEGLVFVLAGIGVAGILAVAISRGGTHAKAIVGLAFLMSVPYAIVTGVPAGLLAPFGVVLVAMLAAGSAVCFLIIVSMISHGRPRIPQPWTWPAIVLINLAVWRNAMINAIEVYEALPPEPSNCYVATAAASGHPRLVGSAPNSTGMPVNGQLRTFKAGEIVIRETTPSLHRGLRFVYDRVGPPAANRVRANRWLADLAFVALLPFQLVTRLALALVLRSKHHTKVGRLYR